jgi:DNA primase
LIDLHTCWSPDHRAFAFPMYDAEGNVTGIRLRKDQFKWSVKGSHSGLFIPYSAIRRVSLDYLLITEGPTDTAAALTIGFFAIGRPACLGCERIVIDVLKELSVKNVVMCVDNDEPGLRGAAKLRKMIPYQFKVSKFVPPTKDLRDFVSHGGTRDLLLSVVKQATRA